MQVTVGGCVLELVQGDIVEQQVDAIVNAANSGLAGGGGVDGAIHDAGGPTIMRETKERYPQGCPTGSAVISGAGELPAKAVIHAVGPIWKGGNHGEAEQLAGAYSQSLELARQHDCQSVALPALSTGAYGYPIDLASRIALKTAIDELKQHGAPARLCFVLFGSGAYGAFCAALEELQQASD